MASNAFSDTSNSEADTNSLSSWSSDTESDTGSDASTDTDMPDMANLNFTDASDTESDEEPSLPTSGAPQKATPPDSPEASSQLLFPTPEIQTAVYEMLSHLDQWWKQSEKLLRHLSRKDIKCSEFKPMSTKIDQILDDALTKVMTTDSSSPGFPIHEIVHMTKAIKEYVFLKIGEVCCRAKNQDKCAKLATQALETLKRFRGAATVTYEHVMAHALSTLNTGEDAESISTPELEELLKNLTLEAEPAKVSPSTTKARSQVPKVKGAKPSKAAKLGGA